LKEKLLTDGFDIQGCLRLLNPLAHILNKTNAVFRDQQNYGHNTM